MDIDDKIIGPVKGEVKKAKPIHVIITGCTQERTISFKVVEHLFDHGINGRPVHLTIVPSSEERMPGGELSRKGAGAIRRVVGAMNVFHERRNPYCAGMEIALTDSDLAEQLQRDRKIVMPAEGNEKEEITDLDQVNLPVKIVPLAKSRETVEIFLDGGGPPRQYDKPVERLALLGAVLERHTEVLEVLQGRENPEPFVVINYKNPADTVTTATNHMLGDKAFVVFVSSNDSSRAEREIQELEKEFAEKENRPERFILEIEAQVFGPHTPDYLFDPESQITYIEKDEASGESFLKVASFNEFFDWDHASEAKKERIKERFELLRATGFRNAVLKMSSTTKTSTAEEVVNAIVCLVEGTGDGLQTLGVRSNGKNMNIGGFVIPDGVFCSAQVKCFHDYDKHPELLRKDKDGILYPNPLAEYKEDQKCYFRVAGQDMVLVVCDSPSEKNPEDLARLVKGIQGLESAGAEAIGMVEELQDLRRGDERERMAL